MKRAWRLGIAAALVVQVAGAAPAVGDDVGPPLSAPGPEQVGEVLRIHYESPDYAGPAGGEGVGTAWREEIHFPGASYIAPHFSFFNLPPGAELIVRSPDGSRSWSYSGFGKGGRFLPEGFWGIHIAGDRAVLELASKVPLPRAAVVVDSFAHGYPADAGGLLVPESICGTNDVQEAKCFQASEPTIYGESRAVARLLINGISLCTGWLVGDDGHLLTNNHCIGSSSSALNTDYEFLAEGATCATNCRSTLACPGTVAATSGTLVQTDVNLDYTLVKLPASVAATYGFMQLRGGGAVLGERIYLPGHPAGWGKQIGVASTHTANPSGFCEVDSLSEPPCIGGSVAEVGYFCDTQGGSSGSPVLGYSDHCVVALHHCRGNAACTGTGGDPNRGVPIQNVIGSLGGNLPSNALCGAGGAFQAGTRTIDEQVRTVTLSGFGNPISVLGPPSFNGSHPSTTRLQNVTSTSFQYFLDEWDYLDGGHVNESIGFLALEAGTSNLGGLDAEAGAVSINHNWTPVSFNQSFTAAPVVVAQVASFNGGQAATTRLRNVSASGFEIRLQEEEANDGTHVFETVHWIAVETGTASVGGSTFVVARTGNSVTHNFFGINFGQSLSNPVLVAEMQTFNGNNPAALRHQSLTSTGVQVKVEEEQSLDDEVAHVTEVVGYIAVSP